MYKHHIKYDEHELLEFFKELPIFIGLEEAQEFTYSSKGGNDVRIIFSASVYENRCKIGLYLHEGWIFETTIENVNAIRTHGDGLRICQSGHPNDYVIYNKPNFFIVTTDNECIT